MPRYSIYFPHLESTISFKAGTKYFNYISNVLRLKEGDSLYLLDGKGKKFIGSIISLDRKRKYVEINVLECVEDVLRKKPDISLFCAVPKGDKFFYIVQKATELGVYRIVPLITEYQQKIPSNNSRFLERARLISIQALEQSRGEFLPCIEGVKKLEECLKAPSSGVRVLFDPSCGKHLKEEISSLLEEDNIEFFIGPEGGFSPEEIKLAKDNNVKIVSVPEYRILRTETAAVVIAGLLIFLLRGQRIE